jgi:hypothetical protein
MHSLPDGENPANNGQIWGLCTRLCTYPYAFAATGAGISTADAHSTMASVAASRYTCRLPMPSPHPLVSTRLKRAAAAEHTLLAQRRERIEQARAGVQTQLERLEHELADIDQHLALLRRIAPDAGDQAPATRRNGAAPPQPQLANARVLRGPAIRTTAVRLLVEHEPAVEAIHYRDWYRLLEAHGVTVAGKKPLAVFLTQVTRSPVIRKTTSPGVYALDRGTAERLRGQLSRLEDELHALTGQPAGPPSAGGVHDRRRDLLLAIGRHQRALDEALRDVSAADRGGPNRAAARRGRRA